MIEFNTRILQFDEQGEKTGWSYIRITAKQAAQLKPDNKKSFRVKGKLDEYPIKGVALLPMGDGDFIMALKAAVRKAIRKNKGATLHVQLELDKVKIKPPDDLLACLADEPEALAFFKSMPLSHQNYFGNWVREAKTEGTRTRRIARIIMAMQKKQNFGEMIRSERQDRQDLMS